MMRAAVTEVEEPADVCTGLTNGNVFLTVSKCHFNQDYFFIVFLIKTIYVNIHIGVYTKDE